MAGDPAPGRSDAPARAALLARDRIKLAQAFDAARMLRDVEAMGLADFVYYDVLPLRCPAHLLDPGLPAPPPSDDYADGSWAEWRDTALLQESAYLRSVVDHFRAQAEVTLVRILRLEDGAVVREHSDPTLGLHIEKSVVRLTIPVLCNPGVEFYLNGSVVPMRPGECWYLRLTDPHRIVNRSGSERINLTLDLLPNAWLESQIAAGIKPGA